MRSRLLVATVAALLAATPASAEPRRKPGLAPRCALSDQVGDVRSGAFDITCADVEIGRKTVIGLLRLRALDDEPLYESAAGARWTMTFAVGETEYTFRRLRAPGAEPRYSYDFGNRRISVIETATEIRWVAQRSDVPGLSRARPKVVSATTAGLLSKDEARAR